jgi:type IV pilus assembly protein PilE
MEAGAVRTMSNRQQKGFTLIEIMIAVAIVGILAAIAYPSYRDQVRKSTRTEAKVALQQAAVTLEKCYTRTMTYVGCPAPQAASVGGHYTVAVSNITATTYTVTATPAGRQTEDSECGSFTLNDAGVKGIASGTGTVARCW